MELQISYVNAILIFAIFALSLNLLLGYAGQVSVAHAAFGAVGGYALAYLFLNQGISLLLGMAVAIVASGLIGLVVGIPALRLSTEFLILTLGGVLTYTGLGRIVRAVRVNPEMSLVVGVDPRTVYLAVFAIGSFLGGVAAVLNATQTAASPDMGFNPLFYAFVVAFLAGLGRHPVTVGLVGLLLGLIESWSALFMSTQWTSLVVFGILFVYVALRPVQLRGLLRRMSPSPATA